MGTATSVMMGVADMPIQTLKMLNIHPDSRSKKGKEKATDDTNLSGESSSNDRPGTSRTTTNLTDESLASGIHTPWAHGSSSELARTQSESLSIDSPRIPRTSTEGSTFASADSSISSADRPLATSKQVKDAQQPGLAESMESAVDTGKGLARMVGAGFKSPMDFSLGVAKGFHNAPKLYGAEVRQVDKVTDLQSGIRTAAKV